MKVPEQSHQTERCTRSMSVTGVYKCRGFATEPRTPAYWLFKSARDVGEHCWKSWKSEEGVRVMVIEVVEK
jgi:hypothetical protein